LLSRSDFLDATDEPIDWVRSPECFGGSTPCRGQTGYGIFDSERFVTNAAGVGLTNTVKTGGDGYFGTVGAGYDWQFGSSWVFGILADGQFGSIKGSTIDPLFGSVVGIPGGTTGSLKNTTNAAAGVRLGYLVAPNVLSYVNGG
jgi:outer membrane immunogenic protein